MKKMMILSVAAVAASVLASASAHALVINVHDANNFAYGAGFTAANRVNTYTGQGAYATSGTVWNSFADPSGVAVNNLLDSNGNATSVSVTSVFGSNSGYLFTAPFKTSDTTNTAANKPAFILGEWQQSNAPVVVTLTGVPAGVYSVFAYNASVDYDRGASFNFATSAGVTGTGHNGINYTENNQASLTPGVPAYQGGTLGLSWKEGENYAQIDNIVVPADGILTMTVAARLNTISNLTGEVNFNGFQLVSVPEPVSISTLGIAALGLLGRRRAR